MDSLDKAFDSLNIKMENTAIKVHEAAQEVGLRVESTRQKESEHQKICTELTKEDRNQAAYEFLVPEAYKNVQFDIDKIRSNIKEDYMRSNRIYRVYNFDNYAGVCQTILSEIRMRRLPSRSYIIGAPDGYGQLSFVNECIITLRKQSYKAVPYISLRELAAIRVESERILMKPFINREETYYDMNGTDEENEFGEKYWKNPSRNIRRRFSFEEYIDADCLFVELTGPASKDIESNTLRQVLKIRGSKGIPTIVLTGDSLEIYKKDSTLRSNVWDHIETFNLESHKYNKLFHVSCYKFKSTALDSKGENVNNENGIVSQET